MALEGSYDGMYVASFDLDSFSDEDAVMFTKVEGEDKFIWKNKAG